MALFVVRKPVLWENAGAAAITGLTKGAALYIKADGTLTTSPDASCWHPINTRGGDRLVLQYRAKIINAGGVTANATNNASFSAVGSFYAETDPDLRPAVVQAAPPTTGTAVETSDGLCYRMVGAITPIGSSNAQRVLFSSNHGTVAWQGNSFFPGTGPVADGTFHSYAVEVGQAESSLTGANAQLFPAVTPVVNMPLRLGGMEMVYVAISFYFDGTSGTMANVRIKGKLRAVVLGDANGKPRAADWE